MKGMAGDMREFCAFDGPGTVPATYIHNSRKSYKQSMIVSFQKTEVTEGKYFVRSQTVVMAGLRSDHRSPVSQAQKSHCFRLSPST